MQKHSIGAVTLICGVGGLIFLLALSVSDPAAAQGFVTPTPLPAIVATQQAANQQVQQAAASNAEADRMEAQAAEIRRNAAAQAAQAAQAYADARSAAAAQNAAAIGEAIGRGEAAVSQLKDSLDGALAINAEQSAIINSLYVSMTQQGAELAQARSEITQLQRINASLNATNETLVTQNQRASTSANVLSIIPPALGFFFLLALIGFGAWMWQKRNGHTIPPAESDVIDAESVSLMDDDDEEAHSVTK